MKRRSGLTLLLVAALLGASPLVAPAARQDTVEIRGSSGSVGRVPRVVADNRRSYVSAQRLASRLKGSWSVKGGRATLTVGKRSAQFVRDQSRAVVQGQPVVLDAPARDSASGWLISEDFLAKGLPRIAPGMVAV